MTITYNIATTSPQIYLFYNSLTPTKNKYNEACLYSKHHVFAIIHAAEWSYSSRSIREQYYKKNKNLCAFDTVKRIHCCPNDVPCTLEQVISFLLMWVRLLQGFSCTIRIIKTNQAEQIKNERGMLINLRSRQNQLLTIFSAIKSTMNPLTFLKLFILLLSSAMIEGQRRGTYLPIYHFGYVVITSPFYKHMLLINTRSHRFGYDVTTMYDKLPMPGLRSPRLWQRPGLWNWIVVRRCSWGCAYSHWSRSS